MTITGSLRALREVTSHPLNRRRQAAAVVDYLRWNIGRRLLRTETILPLADNASVMVSDSQNFGTLAYTCALWDFEEMVFLTHLLRPDDLFLDIGANVGGYTILASAVAGARSLAFEPVPSTFASLVRNIGLNGIQHLATPMQIGIGDVDQMLTMTADQGGLNHVVDETWRGATVQVPVRRLDEVLAGQPSRLVKLDTEGFEINALHGGTRSFAEPSLLAMIVELNGSGDRYGNPDDAVHAEIVRLGFKPHRYDPLTRLLSPLATFNRDSLNTLYVRDVETASALVASGRKVRVRDQVF